MHLLSPPTYTHSQGLTLTISRNTWEPKTSHGADKRVIQRHKNTETTDMSIWERCGGFSPRVIQHRQGYLITPLPADKNEFCFPLTLLSIASFLCSFYRKWKQKRTKPRDKLSYRVTHHRLISSVWRLYRLETVPSGDCTVWRLYRLETVPSGDCAVWRLCRLETVPFGDCAVWRLYRLETVPFGDLPFGDCTVWRLCRLETVPQTIVSPCVCHPVSVALVPSQSLHAYTGRDLSA